MVTYYYFILGKNQELIRANKSRESVPHLPSLLIQSPSDSALAQLDFSLFLQHI